MAVYTDLGVRHVINAWGPMTIIGSARVRPEVIEAMAEAAQNYVDVIELQRAAGQRLARMIGVDACYVAGGTAAGLAIATAATITGTDRGLIARLPDTAGMKNEVIMQRNHRNSYDHAFRQVGVRIVEFGNAWRSFDWELEASITPATVAVVYVYASRTMHEPLSLQQAVDIAHAHGLPVIVDAAAEVPPVGNLRGLYDTGADVVVISGGKGLRGPQNSAIVQTRPEMIEALILNAAPNHCHGRSMKTTKEDIVGLVRAVELFLALDHDGVTAGWERDVTTVLEAVAGIEGIQAEASQARYSEGIPVARLTVDAAAFGRSAADIAADLAAGNPSLRVMQSHDWLNIDPQFLQEGDVELVVARLREALVAA
jgi:D-glucosaminate-6-phosphate ammonia-lyase